MKSATSVRYFDFNFQRGSIVKDSLPLYWLNPEAIQWWVLFGWLYS